VETGAAISVVFGSTRGIQSVHSVT